MTNNKFYTDKYKMHIEKIQFNQKQTTYDDNGFTGDNLSFVICHLSFAL